MKNSKVVSFLSPFKVDQDGNLWTLPRMCSFVMENLSLCITMKAYVGMTHLLDICGSNFIDSLFLILGTM